MALEVLSKNVFKNPYLWFWRSLINHLSKFHVYGSGDPSKIQVYGSAGPSKIKFKTILAYGCEGPLKFERFKKIFNNSTFMSHDVLKKLSSKTHVYGCEGPLKIIFKKPTFMIVKNL